MQLPPNAHKSTAIYTPYLPFRPRHGISLRHRYCRRNSAHDSVSYDPRRQREK